jgi:hypothetical protein
MNCSSTDCACSTHYESMVVSFEALSLLPLDESPVSGLPRRKLASRMTPTDLPMGKWNEYRVRESTCHWLFGAGEGE